MKCYQPIFINKNLDINVFPFGLLVPCGKCLACREAQKREWSYRVLHESSYYKYKHFITLTYNSESVPKDTNGRLVLYKPDLKAYIKRCREALRRRGITDFKYYACGEYGVQTFRPHYHLILLSNERECPSIFKDRWNKGFVYVVERSTYQSIFYTCGYVDKKIAYRRVKDVYDSYTAPFSLKSKGLGRRYALDNRERLSKKLYDTWQGFKIGLSRYYKNILGLRDKFLRFGNRLKQLTYKYYLDKYGKEENIRLFNERNKYIGNQYYSYEIEDIVSNNLKVRKHEWLHRYNNKMYFNRLI